MRLLFAAFVLLVWVDYDALVRVALFNHKADCEAEGERMRRDYVWEKIPRVNAYACVWTDEKP